MRISTLSASALLALAATQVQAQTPSAADVKAFPLRPVRMILASGPGSSPDIIGRLLGDSLSATWGRPVIIDNRPGATGLIAVELLAHAAPDGYTVGLFTMTNLIAMINYQKYQLASELAAVSLVGTTPFAIVVNSATPVKDIAEFIAYAKARPGKLSYGSTGMFGSSHLCMEEFNKINGLKMTHVPYKSAVPAITDVIAGQIHVYCPAAPMLPAYIKAGKIRALGVTYAKPTKLMPGVTPVADTVPGFSLYGWYGMHAPLKTPAGIIKKINLDMAKALREKRLIDTMFISSTEAVGSTPEEYTAFLKKDTDNWTRQINEIRAKQ